MKPTPTEVYKIISVISRKPVETIKPESMLREELGLDSLASLDLLVTLEEKYQIVVAHEEAVQFRSVNDVVSYLDHL
jgi:acyl carrier protein